MKTVKNGLHFMLQGTTFVCRELADLAVTFVATYGAGEIERISQEVRDFLKARLELAYSSKEEREVVPVEERLRKGGEVFDDVVKTINVEHLNAFQQFLFWLGSWWYYSIAIRSKCYRGESFSEYYDFTREVLKKHILPVLPAQIREHVQSMELINVAVGFGHFALLFSDGSGVRRIVTDTRLIELRDVHGYNYLDIDQNGNPIVRCCTERGGNRAFFDGVRLMAHPSFQTCAPKTVIFDAGYKFNSTGVTVVNGTLYPLIDAEDAVAKTTGAFMGMCDFSNQEHLDSFACAEASAARLVVEDDKVVLDGRTIKPLGVFQPSNVTLLDSGFSLYDWSEYHESFEIQYATVMVVDDNVEWLAEVQQSLDGNVDHLISLHTENGDDALSQILAQKPDAVVLDMHLTREERFEGLHIANKLFENGFGGEILIASSYPDTHLKAMAVLIKGPVQVPGKNIARVVECLRKRRAQH